MGESVVELERFTDTGINDGEEMIVGTVGVVDKVDGTEFSVIIVPDATTADAAATAANSSSAFLIKSKSLNELKVLLLSFSFKIDSRWLDDGSSEDLSALDLFDPPTESFIEGGEEYFSEFWYIEEFAVVKNVALGLDGKYGSIFELSCRLTFAKISCKFGGIVMFETLSRIGWVNFEIPGGGGGVNDLVSDGL